MCRIITSEVDDNMDEQNNVDGIRKDDILTLEGNLEQKDMLNNEQAQSGDDQPGQQQNYSPAGQQPYQQPQYGAPGQSQNYGPAGQQSYHGQSGYDQQRQWNQDSYAQQMHSDGQEYQQKQQYSQPDQSQNYGPAGQQSYQQPQYSAPGQPQNYGPAGQQPYHGQSGYDQQRQWNQDSYAQQMQSDGQEYQQKPQYSQPGQPQNYGPAGQQSYQQPQYSTPGQPQNYGPADQQSYQQPQYSALDQSQYGQRQQPTPYDSPMGYVGYEYRQNIPADVKKGSTHIPNPLNIVGMIMALITVFLPYAHMDSDVRTISGVFGIDVISVIIAAVLLVADIISAFMNKTVAYIIDLVISVIVGGALIFEFVLSLIDLGKLDKTVNAGLSFGAWFSVVTAILLLVSVPVWWAVSRKKAKTEKETAESAV